MHHRAHAFSLIEAMITVAIVSIGAALAVPSMGALANAYRSRESARAVMLAMGNARAASQKLNEAVRVTVLADRVEVARPTYSATVATIYYVDGWQTLGSASLGNAIVSSVPTAAGNVAPGSSATLVFCPTGDATFLSAQQQQPLCALGEMVSNGGHLRFAVLGQAFSIEITSALAHLRLKTGA